jgi:hypothetical protein
MAGSPDSGTSPRGAFLLGSSKLLKLGVVAALGVAGLAALWLLEERKKDKELRKRIYQTLKD